MKYISLTTISAVTVLATTLAVVAANPPGTKGQDFDRIVYETSSDDEIELTARIMTINRFAGSASRLTVLDNGAAIFGPETIETERWSRAVKVKGRGTHEILLRCQAVNASPVYCGLSLDDAKARVLD